MNLNSWYWVTEEPGVILKRAAANKKYVEAELKHGRNVLLERPQKAGLSEDKEKMQLEKVKRVAGSEQKAVVMDTYVDDCDMDGRKDLRNLMWAVVRMYFESAEPEDVKKFLGIVHEVCVEEPKLFIAKLNQQDYMMNLLENLSDEWRPTRRCTTVGQAGPPPEIDTKEACPAEVRSMLGSLMYAARCTRLDISYPVARLARYTDRWCEWAAKELKHLLGYIAETVDYGLVYRMEGTVDFEMMKLVTFSDANFAAPYSTGGHIIFLSDGRRSMLPLEWRSKKQQISATSSGESEALEWGAAAKGTVKLASIFEAMRIRPMEATGLVDNDAVRLAVQRGASNALAHLGKHGEVNFRYLQQCGIVLKRVDTVDNVADIFTKVVSAAKMKHLLAGILEAEGPSEGRTIIAHVGCSAAGTTDLGAAAAATLRCSCAQNRLLQGLVLMAVTTPANGLIPCQMIENITSWQGQSLVTFVPVAEWVAAAAAPDAAHAARAAHAAEAAAAAAVPIPDSDSEEEPHWRRLGFEIDDDGHWVPEGYFDEVEDNSEPESGEGFGCYIAGGGCCMHVSRQCAGLRGAAWTSRVTFCSTIQDEARAAENAAGTWSIDEGWTVTGPLAKKICRTEACCVVCHGGLARLRNREGVEARRRKMRWCHRCSGPIHHKDRMATTDTGWYN